MHFLYTCAVLTPQTPPVSSIACAWVCMLLYIFPVLCMREFSRLYCTVLYKCLSCTAHTTHNREIEPSTKAETRSRKGKNIERHWKRGPHFLKCALGRLKNATRHKKDQQLRVRFNAFSESLFKHSGRKLDSSAFKSLFAQNLRSPSPFRHEWLR